MTADRQSYFPSDYRAARRAFIAACETRGIDVIARVHPGAQGPDGRPLFLDTAALGPRDAKKALLLIAGTHGVEGYFGSGAMTGLLREGIAPPPGTRLVMIHALNPFGFAWQRRTDERNIDVNRNFIDHDNPPANPAYDEIAEAVAPRDASESGLAAADAVLAAYAQVHGARAFQQAVCVGQYAHPGGLFYGGTSESWSAHALRAVLTEDLSRVTALTVIDFHTGLGECGAGQLISEAAPDSPAHARARAIWGEGVVSDLDGQSVSTPLHGTLDRGLTRMMEQAEVTFATLEVGTAPLAQMLKALRLANWQDRFAADDSRAAEVAAAMRDAFYPDTPEWKRAVWALARQAVDAALLAP